MTDTISYQKGSLFCLIFASICIYCNAESGCGDGNWIPYNDEKCILIVDTVVSAEEAVEICSLQDPSGSASLLSIKTKQEQLFLTEQIYEISGVIDNVWVAARRYNGSTFTWTEDNSTVRYSNWAPNFPSNDTEKGCVQMISHLSKYGNQFAEGDGLWHDVSCLKRNLVVCQKLQTLSAPEMQQILFENRRRVEEVENNPVPLGFIYVQLSGQPEPNEIWTKVQFTDVTSEYAGQFFRALGGDSSEFGTTQNFRSPSLSLDSYGSSYVQSLTVPFGSWSPLIYSGSNYGTPVDFYHGLSLKFDITEVRPYNSAVKIWKRTA